MKIRQGLANPFSMDQRACVALIAIMLLCMAGGCSKSTTATNTSAEVPAEMQPTTSPTVAAPAPPHPHPPGPPVSSAPGHIHRREPASVEEAPPSLSDDERLQNALDHLPKGKMAYTVPDKMRTGETARISARIGSPQVSANDLTGGLSTGAGTIQTVQTPVAVRMKVVLKSADFDVVPLSSEEQSVGGKTPTQWDWDVAPKRSGKLHLRISATVVLNNLSRDFTTVDRDVTVTVDTTYSVEKFISTNWQWLAGVLASGVALLWKLFGSRKEK